MYLMVENVGKHCRNTQSHSHSGHVNIIFQIHSVTAAFLAQCLIIIRYSVQHNIGNHHVSHAYFFPFFSNAISCVTTTLSYALKCIMVSDAICRQWYVSTSMQVMICHLCGTKPLPQPMLTLTVWNKLQWIFNKNTQRLVQRNCIGKCHLQNILHLFQDSICLVKFTPRNK